MTAPFDPAEAGWQAVEISGFLDLIGPVWRRRSPDGTVYGLTVTQKHANTRGVAHGGVFTALLDTALGLEVTDLLGGSKHATITLDVQFLTAVRVGDFLVADARVVKATRTMLFVQGALRVGDRVCAIGQGTWKVLGA